MFDRYYCIKTFCDTRKLDNLKKMRWKILIFGDKISAKKTRSLHVFWLRRFQGINNFTFDVTDLGSLLCKFLILTSDFMTALERVLRKITLQGYNSTWISLLKHGFSPVKTWLLIPRDTAFYAIIHFHGKIGFHWNTAWKRWCRTIQAKLMTCGINYPLRAS